MPVSQRTVFGNGNVNSEGLDQDVLGEDAVRLLASTGLPFNSDTWWQSLGTAGWARWVPSFVGWISRVLPGLRVRKDQVFLQNMGGRWAGREYGEGCNGLSALRTYGALAINFKKNMEET